MADSIAAIKQQLVAINISTATPGLQGDDRLEELKLRLDVAQKSHEDVIGKANLKEPSIFANLSMAEIRSRLVSMGGDTATPGLVGDDRRRELIRRLIDTICGSNNPAADLILDEVISNSPLKSLSKEHIFTPAPDESILTVDTQEFLNELMATDAAPSTNDLSLDDISGIKKDLKRLSNRRAVVIAGRLSGDHQDKDLKSFEKSLSRTEAEISRLRSIPAKGQTCKISSVLVDNGNTMMNIGNFIFISHIFII